MPAFVALLRAVNVGGRATIKMADLRALAERIGLRDARTVLQSGNLVFEADDATPAELEGRLEGALAATLGLTTGVLVRSVADWRALVAALPFQDLARADPAHLVAMPLRAAPDSASCAALEAAIAGRERVAILGATAYVAYVDGIGRSKLTNARIERMLGTSGTGRNWRTVLEIAALLDS